MSRNYKINILIIIVNLIVFNLYNIRNCHSLEIKFEYDKYFSTTAGVCNTKTMYDIFSTIQDEKINNIKFKLFGSSILTYLSFAIGHELFGHGYPLRRYDIPKKYDIIPPMVHHSNKNSPLINSQIYIGGLNFNKKYEDEFIEDGMIRYFDYKNSNILFYSKLVYLKTLYASDNSDFDYYINNLKKINPDTKIEGYLKKSVNLSLLSPPFLISNYILGKAFYTGDISYTFNYLPTLNFNLYPMAITREIGISVNVNSLINNYNKIDRINNKCQYMRLTYEFGQDVWNKKVSGFSFEYTNITIYKSSVDLVIHHVDKCTSNTLLTLNFKHLYLRWKYQFKKFDNLEPKNNFAIGVKL